VKISDVFDEIQFSKNYIPGNDEYSYKKDQIIVMTPNKNYLAWDLETMFKDLGLDIIDKKKI